LGEVPDPSSHDLSPAAPRAPVARVERLALLASLAVAVAAYARTLQGELVFDDRAVLVENPAIRSLGAWLAQAFQPGAIAVARPLTSLTFAANYALGGLQPLGYHAVNLALHLATVLLAAALAARVAGLAGAERPRRIGVAVAGLFAVHPLQSEAVSYVSQRAEVLASALYLATLLLLLSAGSGATGRARALRGGALLTFALGLAAKPILLSLPLAALAIDAARAPGAPDEAGGARGARRFLALLGVGAAAYALAGVLALRGSVHAGFSIPGKDPWSYLLTQLRVHLLYLRLLAWPAGQNADRSFPASAGLSEPATLASALAVLGIAVAAAVLLLRGRRAGAGAAAARLAGLGLVWWFVVLSVTSSFVPLADPVAEHRVYLASWGVFLAVCAAGDHLAARLRAPAPAAIVWLAVLLALATALHRRNAVWETAEAFWTDVLVQTPAARAHAGLGQVRLEQGRYAEAIQEYEAAIAGTGSNLALRAAFLHGLGAAQWRAGRVEDSRRTLAEALHFRPDDEDVLVELAVASGATGDAAAAEALAQRVLRRSPGNPRAWTVLGNLALERGDLREAIANYDRVLSVDPERGEAHYGRALALGQLGRAAEECSALEAGLRARLTEEYRARIGAEVRARCR
jgi:tetratricopeptide (TPR) repeat protein